jgi:fatty acid desaturase
MDPLRGGHGIPLYESAPPPRKRERGVFLSAFLIFNGIANMGLAAGGIYNAHELSKEILLMPTADEIFAPKLAIAAAVVAFANLVSLMGVWSWKQWGIYMVVALSSVGALIAIRLDYAPNIVANLISVVLLLILAGPKWKDFD